jgi:hypothetical protein
MTDPQMQLYRAAVIARLASGSPQQCLGRTAVMKFCYFLQTLRRVPLGYRFSLYSYGPFDSDVLADLDSAEALGLVSSTVDPYPGGYGYRIRPGDSAANVDRLAGEFLARHDNDIRWVLDQFSNLSAAELELFSTVIYVDREATRARQRLSEAELVRQVQDLKPRFTDWKIRTAVQDLTARAVLVSVGG